MSRQHHHQERALSASIAIEDDDPSANSSRICSSPVGVPNASSNAVVGGAVTPSTRCTATNATPFDTSAAMTATAATTTAIPRQNLFGASSSSSSPELVVLNVGGHTFTTTRSTLFSVPGSFLEAMFSGRHAHCAHQTADGAYFIDRDGRFVQCNI
jgi:BTB/POZ domain